MAQKIDRFITLRVYRSEYNDLEAIKRQLSAQTGNPMSFAFIMDPIICTKEEGLIRYTKT